MTQVLDSKSFPYSPVLLFFRMIIILLPTFTSLKENVFLLQHLNLKAQKTKKQKTQNPINPKGAKKYNK